VRDSEPPAAVAGADRTVVDGDALTLDATASHDNVGVTSFVWTVVGEGGTETFTGSVVTVPMTRSGTLRVELRVADAAGNTAVDALDIQVLPLMVDWRLGPFLDEDGRPLKGVRVSVTLNGTERAGITDAAGWLTLSIVRFDLVSPAQVSASKRGYETVRFATALDADGDPVDPVPRIRRLETTVASGLLSWFLLAAVVVCAVVAIVLRRMRRTREAPKP
jgi:hypothetical protein